jgi:hypothetical protein
MNMKQQKLLLFVLLLLVLSVGIGVMAQSSENFVLQRFTMTSGGHSGSANYAVDAVIGQPATGRTASSEYTVSAGFLQPGGLHHKVWLPLTTR